MIQNLTPVGEKNKNRLRLSEAIIDFRIYLEATGRASNTINNYLRSLEWLMGIVGDVPLRQISSESLSSAVVEIKKSSHSVGQRSASTMNRIKSAYRSFFKRFIPSGQVLPRIYIRVQRTFLLSREPWDTSTSRPQTNTSPMIWH
jgi:hypothetical protein